MGARSRRAEGVLDDRVQVAHVVAAEQPGAEAQPRRWLRNDRRRWRG